MTEGENRSFFGGMSMKLSIELSEGFSVWHGYLGTEIWMMARVFIYATPSSQSVQVQWSRCPIAESHYYCWTWELYRTCLCFFFSSLSTYHGLRRQYRKLKSLGWKLGPSSVTVDTLVIVKVYIGLALFLCKIKTHCVLCK